MVKNLLILLFCLGIALPCLAEGESEKQFKRLKERRELLMEAETAEKEESYKSAAKKYYRLQELTEKHAEKAKWLLKSADCYMAAGKSYDAWDNYKELFMRYPLYIPHGYAVGQLRKLAEKFAEGDGTFLGLRDPDIAISIYEMILQESPSINISRKDRERLAELQELNDRPEEAIATYQEILKLDPKNHDIRLKLAKLLLKLSYHGDGDGLRVRAALRNANHILDNDSNYARRDEVLALKAECIEIQARRTLDLAKFYFGKAQYRPKAGNMYLEETIRNYPGTKAAVEALELQKKMAAQPQPLKK